MKKSWSMMAAGLALLSVVALAADPIEEKRSVEWGGAKSARVELRSACGDVSVSGGAQGLMDADFKYRPREHQPEVNYYVQQGKGYLSVIQTKCMTVFNPVSRWDIKLSNQAPLDLSVQNGSGNVVMNLTAMDLENLAFADGSGDVTATLDGSYPHLKRAQGKVASGEAVLTLAGNYPVLEAVAVDASSGRATLKMPGVYPALRLVDSELSSGEFNLDLGGFFPLLEKLILVVSSGSGELKLTGEYGAPMKMTVQNSSGSMTLDLSGQWKAGFEGVLIFSSGKAVVKLPADVGVRVEVEKSSGLVKAEGLKKDGPIYANDLWGVAPVNFVLRADFSSGTLELIAKE